MDRACLLAYKWKELFHLERVHGEIQLLPLMNNTKHEGVICLEFYYTWHIHTQHVGRGKHWVWMNAMLMLVEANNKPKVDAFRWLVSMLAIFFKNINQIYSELHYKFFKIQNFLQILMKKWQNKNTNISGPLIVARKCKYLLTKTPRSISWY